METPQLNNNKDFDFALEFGQIFEQELLNAMVGNLKIEVKTEKSKWRDTGNIFLEYESRGKPSGLVVSKADYFAFCLADDNSSKFHPHSFFLISTAQLRHWLSVHKKEFKPVNGGDDNTSKGILIPINRLHEIYYA